MIIIRIINNLRFNKLYYHYKNLVKSHLLMKALFVYCCELHR